MIYRRDTVVIGGGAMGSATAWQLAGRGRQVTLLERFAPGHTFGASHGASRNFNVAYSDPAYVSMLVEALRMWRELEAESDSTLLDLVGIVNHGPNPDYRLVHGALAAAGIPAEFLPASEASRRWPGIRFETEVLYTPQAGTLNADAAVKALQTGAAARGAEIRHNTPVRRLEVLDDDRVRLILDDEVIEARRVVVTAGAWTTKLLTRRLLADVPGLSLPPLVVTQEQPAHFAVRDESIAWPGFNHVPDPYDAASDYWRSPVYGLLTPGEGVKAGWHGVGPVTDPDARTFTSEPEQLAALRRYAREWLPGVDADSFVEISCTYTSTPDSNFYLASDGPIAVGAGFSGHGFKFTPAIGRILADLADGRRAAPMLVSSPWP